MTGRYAFLSHESAVEANRALACGALKPLLDPGLTVLPEPGLCITSQRQFEDLERAACPELFETLSRPVHLLVPSAAARSRGRRVRFHVWSDALPDQALVRVHEQVFVSSPAFALLQLALFSRPTTLAKQRAAESAREDARIRRDLGLDPLGVTERDLLSWENVCRMVETARVLMEFAGTYRLPCIDGEEVRYGQGVLVTREELETFAVSFPHLKGVVRARQIVGLAFDGSASPMETALVLMLTLPIELGGYGLPRPVLNMRIVADGANAEVVSQPEMYADLCWPQANLVLEYNSDAFHRSCGARKLTVDSQRANGLTAMGYRVLSATYAQVAETVRLDLLARQIARILGVDLPCPTELQRIWRTRLQALLLPRLDCAA